MTSYSLDLTKLTSQSKLSIIDDSRFSIIRSQVWWSHKFRYRRNTSFTVSPTGLPAGHPVSIYVPRTINYQGKVRTDLEDLEVVYLHSASPQSWELLGRNITTQTYNYKVDTVLPVSLAGNTLAENRFYVYYGNPNQTSNPQRPTVVSNNWPLTAAYTSPFISYTYPGVHWKNGISNIIGAKATFSFYGPWTRLSCYKGPAYGILEVQIDDGDWNPIDLFNKTDIGSQVVLTTSPLSPGSHAIRIRVTGEKNPSSTSASIRIDKFEYRNHSIWQDKNEEHDETLLWGGVVSGT